ncbi:MAG TPA: hypothetical protein VL966_17420 [Alphaproteobacteria bacterium]|jgi:hypothetical protein|nr:hypothetical protein [Alphaproteobacteria bacterium]
MARSIQLVAAVGVAALLAGCSAVSDTLFPSTQAPAPTSSSQSTSIPPSRAESNPQPTITEAPPSLGASNFQPRPVTPGTPTGTEVGRRVQSIRDDLSRLQGTIRQQNSDLQAIRGSILQASQRYHTTVGAMSAKLQAGTTPGNPQMVAQFNSAQADLDSISSQLTKLNSLSTNVAGSASQSGYLQETIQATYTLSGAVDEDHRQLNVLGDDLNRTTVLLDRLQNEVSQDVTRQANYVADERRNLNALSQAVKTGHMVGIGLSSRATTGPVGRPTASAATRGRPLVVIRFDRPNVDYQQTLNSVVNRALERDPGASFELVAVTPTRNEGAASAAQARRNAEGVLRSLTGMGLPASRISMSSTSSADARSNEVQIYVR